MDDFRIDGTKIMFHPERVAQWKNAKDWEAAKNVYPLYVEITPCGACNHRCTFCACDFVGYKAVMFDTSRLIGSLQEMNELGVKSVMFAGEGEPLLHKDINRIAAACPMDVSFTTNGVLLNRLALSNVEWVKVSLNAGQRSTYAQIHRTKEDDFDTVWRNLKDAAKRKEGCTLGVQCVLLPENRAEVFMLAHMVKDAGCDYFVVKPYSQHKKSITHRYEGVDYTQDQGLADALETVSSNEFQVIYRVDSMKQESEEIHYDKCNSTPFFWAFVSANGDVYGCSAYLLDERFKYGNLHEQTFEEIWQGEKRRASYEYIKDGLDINECRKNCRLDKANRYLSDLAKGVPHQNFI